MNASLRYTAATIIATLSLAGIFINSYVFKALTKQKSNLSIFYKLCIFKTICNLITCAAFAVWVAPCTYLNFYYMPIWVNILWGQMAGWGAYTTGICIQLCISLNRLTVTYFPFSTYENNKVFNIRNCLIFLVILFVSATAYGLPVGCGYIYYIEALSWLPVESDCAFEHADQIYYLIITVALISNCSNLATFLKLVKTTANNGVSVFQGNRTKKNRLMFAQSVTQDCLHLVDTFMCQFFYKFNDGLWFQFLCMSVSWISIHVFDGFVMLLYNKEIHPAFLKRRCTKPAGKTISSQTNVISRVV